MKSWQPTLCTACEAAVEAHAAKVPEGRGTNGDLYCPHNHVYGSFYVERDRVVDVALRGPVSAEAARKLADEAVATYARHDAAAAGARIQ